MSDKNTAIPVRTKGDLQEKLQSKLVDFVDPTLGAQIDSDKNLHVEIHGNDPTGVDKVIKVSESGNVVNDGFYDVAANTVPSSHGLIASIRNATPSLSTMLQRLTSVTNGLKRLLDVSIHDENGDAFTNSNPLPVTLVDSEGVEVNQPNSTTDLAVAASADHDYTVTALKTLKASKVFASGSGKIKAEVKIETGLATGIFTTTFVKLNSVAEPNIEFDIKELINVAAGVKVRVTITNLEEFQAFNVYSTICGHEI